MRIAAKLRRLISPFHLSLICTYSLNLYLLIRVLPSTVDYKDGNPNFTKSGPVFRRGILNVVPYEVKIPFSPLEKITEHAEDKEVQMRIVNFPPLPGGNAWRDFVKDQNRTAERTLEILTEVIQEQLESLGNSPTACSNYTLLCGHIDECGLGCQIHHRGSCLLLSYVLGAPLIHDATHAWPFTLPWEGVYKKLGSSCPVNNNTIIVMRTLTGVPVIGLRDKCPYQDPSCLGPERWEYPLTNGVPIPKDLHQVLRGIHDDPFLWFVGQFFKFTTRSSDGMKKRINTSSSQLKFYEKSHVVGIHVRRTDKTTEADESYHEVQDYMSLAGAYFNTQFRWGMSSDDSRAVYVASDDHTVLQSTQNNYTLPMWRVIGLQSKATFRYQFDRALAYSLKLIVQDIHFLSKCEHVICGLSSNVCRLILELLATQYPDTNARLKSLDGSYTFLLLGHIVPKVLIPS